MATGRPLLCQPLNKRALVVVVLLGGGREGGEGGRKGGRVVVVVVRTVCSTHMSVHARTRYAPKENGLVPVHQSLRLD